MGWPAIAVETTVLSVPSPPCTTSCTMGVPLISAATDSSAERMGISEAHAAEPSSPLSTRTKCVWYGLSGAPLRSGWASACLSTYGATWLG